MIGWYYLHENGSLIYKPDSEGIASDFRDSDFVKMFWMINTEDRECVWSILVEALAAGANKERVLELAEKWGCSNEDASVYADRVGCALEVYTEGVSVAYPASYSKSMPSSPLAEGCTSLEAMANLCKKMGYKPQKTWGHTFKSLLERKNAK